MLNDPFVLLNQFLPVSRETFDRLSTYHDLLLKWQPKINLVSSETLSDAWRRHFLDSAQIAPYLLARGGIIVDMGSGAGFPGMVAAILGVKDIHLIESDAKKISFLQEVARTTKTAVTLHHQRIEKISEIKKADVILARACADLNQLLNYASYFVSHETTCLFHKGKNWAMEIEDAKENWSFKHQVFPSVTDREAAIIELSNVERLAP